MLDPNLRAALLLMVIFAFGFAAGFGMRHAISHRRHQRMRRSEGA